MLLVLETTEEFRKWATASVEFAKSMGRAVSRRAEIKRRLWEKSIVVDRGYKTPCHEWQGPSSGEGRGGGYGRISLNDGTCAVHLVAWTNAHGYIPPRKQVDHKCNNRRCWRDEHLELMSHKKNQKLRAARAKAK